eukprot:tig00000841_g4736.t1
MGKGWSPAEGKLDLEEEGRTEWPAKEIAAAGPANIRVLDLDGNKLTRIPGAELAKLTNLEKLYLSDNQLTALPPEIGRLAALQALGVSSNRLTALPPEIGRLSNLQQLFVRDNQVTALPPEIGRLAALKELLVSDNQLTALPPEIGRLSALRTLDVSGNQLTALPPEIGRLAALKELYVSKNQLTALPPEIGRLAALKYLHVDGNPVVDSWPAVRRAVNENEYDGEAQLAAVVPYLRSLPAPAPAPAAPAARAPPAPAAPSPPAAQRPQQAPAAVPQHPPPLQPAADGKAWDCFVSYAHVDAALVFRYCDALEAAGFKIWVDRELKAGQKWMAKIGEAMQRCRTYVCFLSPAYIRSNNCDDEMQFAHHQLRIPKFPVWLVDPKSVELPVDYRMMLASVNWTMQRGQGTAAADAAAGELVAGLRDFLRHGSSLPGPRPGPSAAAPAEEEKSCSVQ